MNSALFLEPVDGWSFRDGKPFDTGGMFEASSLFPPTPWTTMGCVRTTLLRQICDDPERYAGHGRDRPCPRCGEGPCAAIGVVGEAGRQPPFALGPPLPARWQERSVEVFFPTPRDLVLDRKEQGSPVLQAAGDPPKREPPKPRFLRPVRPPAGVVCSLRDLKPLVATCEGRLVPYVPAVLPATQLQSCLDGVLPNGVADQAAKANAPPPRFELDPRVGVAIDPATRSARERHLYVRDVVFPEPGAGLAIAVHGDVPLDGKVGRLGGDGRMVRFRGVAAFRQPAVPTHLDGRFRVYLAAPTLLEGGWRPGFIDQATLCGRRGTGAPLLRLVAAALAPAAPIGGWDLATQQPRMLRRMVGAGSVFFFEVEDGSADEAAASFHGKVLCDDESMHPAGFGLAFAGRY